MRLCWRLEAGGRWSKNHRVEDQDDRLTMCGAKPPLYPFDRRLDDSSFDDCHKCFPRGEIA